MSKHNHRRKKKHRPSRDVHPPFDPDLALASHALDAAADREWFRNNPGVRRRLRPATLLEEAALGLEPGSTTLVFLAADGSQGRIMLAPGDNHEDLPDC